VRVAREEREKFEEENKSLLNTPEEDSFGDEQDRYIH
jgi:hypothetical protein